MLESTRKAVPAPKKGHHQNRNFMLQINALHNLPSSTSWRKTATVPRLVLGDFGGVFFGTKLGSLLFLCTQS